MYQINRKITPRSSSLYSSPRWLLLLLLGSSLFFGCTSGSNAGDVNEMKLPYTQSVRAPEFPKGMDWLNTDNPLSLSQLRGKVVVLDFWTYCCINCMHVLPKLHDLEQKYGDNLVVIGVHSAKFEGEGETENIRQAILRYDIEHPVLNDNKFVVWKSYAVQAWPTMVLIDPDGYIAAVQSGEGAPEYFDPLIAQMIDSFSKAGKLDSTPLDLALEKTSAPSSLLLFPGKVHVDEAGDRLFISDSGHHRVIIVKRSTGAILDVIGSGEKGLKGGNYDEAMFNDPQGLELVGDILYVADTKNHALRAIDLQKKEVSLVAGTGQQGGYGRGASPALETRLTSPWDLVWADGKLFIAMAGPHQIWYYDPDEKEVNLWAGSGRENIVDGPRLLAALAQPSGLTTDGSKRLFFADSEVSAIRSVDLADNGGVNTIVGQGLFDFGDVDGGRTKARLQHPLGVAWHEGVLYVADTYNNKIKIVVPEEYSSKTYAGTGVEGHADGALDRATFDEPGGLDVAADGTIYLADTNNHLIRVVDPESGSVSTLQLTDMQPMLTSSANEEAEILQHAPVYVPDSGEGIQLSIQFPEGFKLNSGGGLTVAILSSEGLKVEGDNRISSKSLPVTIPIKLQSSTGSITLAVDYFYCREDNEGLCYIGNQQVFVPLTSDSNGQPRVQLVVE